MKELVKTLWKHKIACLIILLTCINDRKLEIENILHGNAYDTDYFGTATKIGFIAIFFVVYCIGKIGYYKNLLFVTGYFVLNQFIVYQLHAYFDVYDEVESYVIVAIYFFIPLLVTFHFGYARSFLRKGTIRGRLAWHGTIAVIFFLILWLIQKISSVTRVF